MSPKKNLHALIDQETERSEATRDRPFSTRAARKGRAKSVVYSLRLTPEQAEEIQRVADDAGVPASALVRDWVLHGLAAEGDWSSVDALVEGLGRDVDRLRRHLRGCRT